MAVDDVKPRKSRKGNKKSEARYPGTMFGDSGGNTIVGPGQPDKSSASFTPATGKPSTSSPGSIDKQLSCDPLRSDCFVTIVANPNTADPAQEVRYSARVGTWDVVLGLGTFIVILWLLLWLPYHFEPLPQDLVLPQAILGLRSRWSPVEKAWENVNNLTHTGYEEGTELNNVIQTFRDDALGHGRSLDALDLTLQPSWVQIREATINNDLEAWRKAASAVFQATDAMKGKLINWVDSVRSATKPVNDSIIHAEEEKDKNKKDKHKAGNYGSTAISRTASQWEQDEAFYDSLSQRGKEVQTSLTQSGSEEVKAMKDAFIGFVGTCGDIVKGLPTLAKDSDKTQLQEAEAKLMVAIVLLRMQGETVEDFKSIWGAMKAT